MWFAMLMDREPSYDWVAHTRRYVCMGARNSARVQRAIEMAELQIDENYDDNDDDDDDDASVSDADSD